MCSIGSCSPRRVDGPNAVLGGQSRGPRRFAGGPRMRSVPRAGFEPAPSRPPPHAGGSGADHLLAGDRLAGGDVSAAPGDFGGGEVALYEQSAHVTVT